MMRRGCLIAVMVLVALLGIAAALVFSTPATSDPVALEGSAERIEMLRMVPADATDVTVIPAAAPLLRQLRKHPVTEDWIDEWQSRNSGRLLPLLLGSSDVVAWRRGEESGYIANPDPLRRMLIRAWLATGRRGVDIRVERGFLAGGAVSDAPAAAPDLPAMIALTRGTGGVTGGNLGPMTAHLFHFQRDGSESRYPPLDGPVVTGVVVSGHDIVLTSRAASGGSRPSSPLPILSFPRNAMVATAASASPEWLGRVERVLPVKLNSLLDRGAMLALYRVDEKTLVPRIEGLVVLPAGNDAAELRSVLDSIAPRISLVGLGEVKETRRTIAAVEVIRREGFGYTIDYASHRGNLIIAFDDSSMEKYLSDSLAPLELPADRTVWFARVRPAMLEDAVTQLREREELSLIVPDVYESIGELGRWLQYFHGVSEIVVGRIEEDGYAVVKTTISAPK